MWAHLILTSSNGTTTNDSVALYEQEKFQRYKNVRSLRYNSYPAAQPVITERFWFIFFSPDSSRKVLPQKSFAALRDGQSLSTERGGTFSTHNLVARFGASSNNGGTRPACQPCYVSFSDPASG